MKKKDKVKGEEELRNACQAMAAVKKPPPTDWTGCSCASHSTICVRSLARSFPSVSRRTSVRAALPSPPREEENENEKQGNSRAGKRRWNRSRKLQEEQSSGGQRREATQIQ